MSESIAYREFVRGAGSCPNRKILFFKTEENAIYATYFAKKGISWTFVCQLDADQINFDVYSSDNRMQMFVDSRRDGRVCAFHDPKPFQQLSLEEREKAMDLLRFAHPSRLEIAYGTDCCVSEFEYLSKIHLTAK